MTAPRANEVLDRATHPDGVHRDYWTRPIYPLPDAPDAETKCRACDAKVPGKPFTRMTKFIDVLEDKFALERWFQRQVLKGVVLKEHLVLKASNALNPDDLQAEKAALDKVCKEAAEAAGKDDARDKGVELHRLIERIIRGQKVKVPAAFRADIEALHNALAEHRLTSSSDDLEVNIVHDGVKVQSTAAGIGGRFDLLLTMAAPCPSCGRVRRVGDFKTGQVWYHACDRKRPCGKDPGECPRRHMYGADEFRMQLAGYASGRRIDALTGERTDLDVCQCWGYVIHLPAGKGMCEILLTDLERGRLGLGEAYRVWLWRAGNTSLDPAPLPDIPASTDPASTALPPAPRAVEAAPVTGPPEAHGEGGNGGPVPPENLTALIAIAADRANLLGLRTHYHAIGVWQPEHDEAARRRVAELEASQPPAQVAGGEETNK